MGELTGAGIGAGKGFVYDQVVRNLHGRRTGRWRTRFLSPLFREFGKGSAVGHSCRFLAIDQISVGRNTYLPNSSVFDGRGGLTIGDDCLIGFGSVILTSTHRSERVDVPIRSQGMFAAPVIIGDGSWLGCRVIVQPGVTIGKGAIVGSGAVVTKDVAPFSIVGGVPARVLRMRTSHDMTLSTQI